MGLSVKTIERFINDIRGLEGYYKATVEKRDMGRRIIFIDICLTNIQSRDYQRGELHENFIGIVGTVIDHFGDGYCITTDCEWDPDTVVRP